MRTIELRMDISNSCNLTCIMCHQPFANKKVQVTSPDDFKRAVADILPEVSVLYLSWATEPLLNPHLAEILTIVKKAGVPCIIMVTNLTTFPAWFKESFHLINRLHVSIDAADPAIYAAIRQRDCLPSVISHVQTIQKLKKERGLHYPRIAFNAVLLRMNLDQLVPLCDLAVSLGVDELNLAYVSTPERYNNESPRILAGLPMDFNLKNEVLTPDDRTVHPVLKTAIRYAEAHGILVTVAGRFALLKSGFLADRIDRVIYAIRKGARFPPRALWHLAIAYLRGFFLMRAAYCSYPFRQVVLTAEGDVFPCCVWETRESLGSIHLSTLREIWQGAPFSGLRKKMLHGELPRLCIHCNRVNSKKRHGV